MAGAGKGVRHQLLGVIDQTDGGDGEHAQMGAHQQRLGIRVGDTADAGGTAEFGQIAFKLGTERGIFNIVDLALETLVDIVKCHTAPAGAEVGVVVHAKVNV